MASSRFIEGLPAGLRKGQCLWHIRIVLMLYPESSEENPLCQGNIIVKEWEAREYGEGKRKRRSLSI